MGLNNARKLIINNIHETIPISRILVVFSIIDDMILMILEKDFKNFFDKIHEMRENILYMLSFEKAIKEEQEQNE